MRLPPSLILHAAFVFAALSPTLFGAEISAEQRERGSKIFTEKCLVCHQPTGQGVPGVFPPLAGSDWLKADIDRAIKVLCEGLSGPLVVNGQRFDNAMPAQILDDQQVADVISFVGASWGNELPPVTAEKVRAVRATSRFATYDALLQSAAFQPLPKPPEGWTLRELTQLPEFCVRFARGGGRTFVLAQNGSVYEFDPASNAVGLVLNSRDYIDPERGEFVTLGIAVDPKGRLLISSNQNLTKGVEIYTNEVIIWRSEAAASERPIKMQPWFRTTYPRGIGGMNHGVSHLAFGPDGMLYVASGSRTDGGEGSKDRHYFGGGEVDITAGIWRIDPNAAEPKIEVIAHGIRNAYGFAWDGAGNLFTFANGPDASAPEEMDFIQPGRHYGFPYQFSDWPAQAGSPYPHTPAAPPGLKFTLPVRNVGPAAGGSKEKPIGTFDAHSSPAGSIWCGDDFPEPLRNGFLVTRFGNLLGAPAAPEDVGFDVLSVHLEKRGEDSWLARTTTVLAPLGRPIDLLPIGGGRVLVLEYTRPTNFRDKVGWLPGRILELAPKPR